MTPKAEHCAPGTGVRRVSPTSQIYSTSGKYWTKGEVLYFILYHFIIIFTTYLTDILELSHNFAMTV
jgi:hypothetical protein